MTALSDNRDTREINGREFPLDLTVVASDIIYAGGMLAMTYDLEVKPAADTLGYRVIGRTPVKVDNTSDGEVSNAEHGIFRYANSTTYPITRAMIGETCYVEDDATVAGSSTYLVAAGLVYDVDSSGVWVDQTAASLKVARMNARIYINAVTATTDTLTAAECFQGNVVTTVSNSSASTVTFPTAIAGYRIGIQRLTAGAGYDVILTPAAGDKILDGDAAATATNTVDAVSDVLWLETGDATTWSAGQPKAKDLASWVTT